MGSTTSSGGALRGSPLATGIVTQLSSEWQRERFSKSDAGVVGGYPMDGATGKLRLPRRCHFFPYERTSAEGALTSSPASRATPPSATTLVQKVPSDQDRAAVTDRFFSGGLFMEKVVRIFKSFEESDHADREYYRSLSPQQRLEILCELNRRWPVRANNVTSEGLARVYRIVRFS